MLCNGDDIHAFCYAARGPARDDVRSDSGLPWPLKRRPVVVASVAPGLGSRVACGCAPIPLRPYAPVGQPGCGGYASDRRPALPLVHREPRRSAYTPSRSRQLTLAPGWSLSQSTKGISRLVLQPVHHRMRASINQSKWSCTGAPGGTRTRAPRARGAAQLGARVAPG